MKAFRLLTLPLLFVLIGWLDAPAPRVFAQVRTSPGTAVIGNNSVDYAQIATDVVQKAAISITSAQYLALNATAVTLVGAQGSGTLVEVLSYRVDYTYGGTAYGGVGTSLRLAYGFGGDVLTCVGTTFISTNVNAVAVNSHYQSGQCIDGSTLSSATMLNQPVVLEAANAPTTGNGTFTLTIFYRIVTGLS